MKQPFCLTAMASALLLMAATTQAHESETQPSHDELRAHHQAMKAQEHAAHRMARAKQVAHILRAEVARKAAALRHHDQEDSTDQ